MSFIDIKNNIPRRARIDLNTDAELSIREAMNKVEEIGADVKLTDAVIKLQEAFNLIADYEDERIKRKTGSFLGLHKTNKNDMARG